MTLSTKTTLAAELELLRNETMSQLSGDVAELIQEKANELARSGVAERSLKVGNAAPDFVLPNAYGRAVHLQGLLQRGPVVVSFYRGGWCPYCNVELRALQRALREFERCGAQLIAVSPQTPDNSLTTAQKAALSFEVLSDVGNRAARQFGIVFTLPDELRSVYERFGIDIPAHNGDRTFELPIPATYVIAADGIVRYTHVNSDYTTRAEPADIVAVLEGL